MKKTQSPNQKTFIKVCTSGVKAFGWLHFFLGGGEIWDIYLIIIINFFLVNVLKPLRNPPPPSPLPLSTYFFFFFCVKKIFNFKGIFFFDFILNSEIYPIYLCTRFLFLFFNFF